MKLQILIPQYKETDEVVKPLLDSIAMQHNVDFSEVGVIICNDGTDVYLSKELLDLYPFHIEYWTGEHKGVSATRNACLDHATADYVMFCDADDSFYTVCALFVIFMFIDAGFDSMNSAFIEETREKKTGKPCYITHDNDATFVHGKVHRRQFLIDNGIRWNDDLSVHEDSFFNILCLNLAKDLKYCDKPFYLWKWRKDSVCRSGPEYMFATYDKLIDSSDAAIDEFIKRGHIDKAMYLVAYMLFEAYYTMNKPEWVDQKNAEYRAIAEKRIGKYFLKWEKLWDSIPINEKLEISNSARQKILKEGMLLESVTIFDWLANLKENVNG